MRIIEESVKISFSTSALCHCRPSASKITEYIIRSGIELAVNIICPGFLVFFLKAPLAILVSL
jgi:hypothetical protein